MHYDIVQTEMHSTYTHGVSEAVFALSFLSNIILASRIANLQKNTLFSKRSYTSKARKSCFKYKKTYHIEDHWDQLGPMTKMASF